jgi:hypothetical protein
MFSVGRVRNAKARRGVRSRGRAAFATSVRYSHFFWSWFGLDGTASPRRVVMHVVGRRNMLTACNGFVFRRVLDAGDGLGSL